VNLSQAPLGLGAGVPVLLAVLLGGCGGNGSAAPPPSVPVISNFAASPAAITSGQSTTLAWQVSGAASVQLSNVTATPTAPSSSVVIAPAATTTYTLTAANSVGSTQQSATVTVTSATQIAGVQINPAAATVPIASNFLGIGQTMGDTLFIVGTSSTNMNSIYEQLLKNLTQYANAPLLIRELADGGSSDVYDASRLSALSQLNQDLGAQFFVGVDFVDDDVATATDEAAQLAAGLPGSQLQAIELGNEPDLYGNRGERPAGWDYDEYLTDYQQFAPALVSASGGIKLSAPVWAGLSSSFMDNLNSFISTEASTIAIVAVHHYSGTACNGATEPPDYLLTEPAVDGDTQPLTGPVGIPPYLPAAQQAGIPFRIGELNSINCGGQLGVSNSFSSALWSMDIAFSYANVGVGGVNFFAPGDPNTPDPYTPFDFTSTSNGGVTTYAVRNINPLYYGLLLFAQTVQNNAQLLPVALTTPTQANIKAWATIDTDQTIRLLLLNKDQVASGPVSIALSGYGQATITRLTAPAYSSTTGVNLGGQTFDGSADGTPQGTAYSEIAQPASGVYTVALPAISAALVNIEP
jgi:Glycosyl hydrolase family 79 C-terminal beta domain